MIYLYKNITSFKMEANLWFQFEGNVHVSFPGNEATSPRNENYCQKLKAICSA